jgi:hypothetical protein
MNKSQRLICFKLKSENWGKRMSNRYPLHICTRPPILPVGSYILIKSSGVEICLHVLKFPFLLKWCGHVRWLHKTHGHNFELNTQYYDSS